MSTHFSRLRPAALYLALVAVSVGGLAPSPATAHAPAADSGEQALARIDYPWPQLGWDVSFQGERPGYLGLAVGPTRKIEIYVRPTQSVGDVAHVLAHEIGHAVDLTYGNERRRREWLTRRGLDPDRSWFGCDSCTDYATPAGDFAEVFELDQLGADGWQSEVAPRPDDDELDRLRVFFLPPGRWPPRAR